MKNPGNIWRWMLYIFGAVCCLAIIGVFVFGIVYTRYLYLITEPQANQIPHMATVTDPVYENAIRQGQQFAKKLLIDWKLPSLSVAVGKCGKIVWVESFGYADLEKMIPVHPDMAYRIHSVNKPLTAMSIANFWEQDSLDLEAPVSQYLPGYPRKKYDINLHQLLSHQSGIRHYSSDEEIFNNTYYPTLDQSLTVFKNDSLLFEPGTSFSYSSYGYNLAGAVTEKVSRNSFMVFMRNTVFEPLGMDHTGIERDSLPGTGLLKYYEMDRNGRRYDAPYIDLSIKYPSGGMASTPADLATFGLALLGNKLIKDSTFRYFTRVQETDGGDKSGYALGWEVSGKVAGWKKWLGDICSLAGWHIPQTIGFSPMIYHRGGSTGGMSMLVIYPDQKIVFAFVTNINGELPTIYKMPVMAVEGFF